MKNLVVYYSRSGITRQLANFVATATGADVEEIVYKENMKGIFGFVKAGHEAMTGKPQAIMPLKSKVEDYDLVILGSPIWAGKLSSPALAFLNQYKGNIKRIAAFLSHGDPKNEYSNAFETIQKASGLSLAARVSLDTKNIKSGHYDIRVFLEQLKKS